MLYMVKIAGYLKILTDEVVDDFVVKILVNVVNLEEKIFILH